MMTNHPIQNVKPILIGIASHAPQSGKTTLANILEKEYGFIREPFAGPIKSLVLQVLINTGIDPAEAEQYVYREKEQIIPPLGVTARRLLQTLGTDWGRKQINERLWLLQWKNSYNKLYKASTFLSKPLLIVVDDVRFPGEADLILSLGGELWEIIRPGVPTYYTLPKWCSWILKFLPKRWHSRLHVSEGLLKNYGRFTRTITNDGSIQDLKDIASHIAAGGFTSVDPDGPYRYMTLGLEGREEVNPAELGKQV